MKYAVITNTRVRLYRNYERAFVAAQYHAEKRHQVWLVAERELDYIL